MATWYWSANTLFWQMSIDHSMDLQYQRSTRQTKTVCLWQPIIWSMTAMLRDSVVVVVVVRTRPRALPLAMITMRKSTHGFPPRFPIRAITQIGIGKHRSQQAVLLLYNISRQRKPHHFFLDLVKLTWATDLGRNFMILLLGRFSTPSNGW